MCQRLTLFKTGPMLRADFREGDEDSNFQFSESGGSLNGPDLFTELPVLLKSLPNPSFTECLPHFHRQTLFFPPKIASSHPLPKTRLLHVVVDLTLLLLLLLQESDERFKAVEQTLEPLQMDIQHLQVLHDESASSTKCISSERSKLT